MSRGGGGGCYATFNAGKRGGGEEEGGRSGVEEEQEGKEIRTLRPNMICANSMSTDGAGLLILVFDLFSECRQSAQFLSFFFFRQEVVYVMLASE